jgi:hypothetical protein
VVLLVLWSRRPGRPRVGLPFLATGVVQLILVLVFAAEFHTVASGGQLSPEVGFYGELLAAVLIGVGGLVGLRGPATLSAPVAGDPFAAPAAPPVTPPPSADPFAPPPGSSG